MLQILLVIAIVLTVISVIATLIALNGGKFKLFNLDRRRGNFFFMSHIDIEETEEPPCNSAQDAV